MFSGFLQLTHTNSRKEHLVHWNLRCVIGNMAHSQPPSGGFADLESKEIWGDEEDELDQEILKVCFASQAGLTSSRKPTVDVRYVPNDDAVVYIARCSETSGMLRVESYTVAWSSCLQACYVHSTLSGDNCLSVFDS